MIARNSHNIYFIAFKEKQGKITTNRWASSMSPGQLSDFVAFQTDTDPVVPRYWDVSSLRSEIDSSPTLRVPVVPLPRDSDIRCLYGLSLCVKVLVSGLYSLSLRVIGLSLLVYGLSLFVYGLSLCVNGFSVYSYGMACFGFCPIPVNW